ncbi:3-oxoacyl-ACP synthase III family protein [Streptomyces sp. NPDC007808]|uniref:3-oxoacyl-ACP synthase III family protein n=1 Tax=Streptomyces sp. NPDC007808 TaxID=3364779 RepID=UPI0036CDF2CA
MSTRPNGMSRHRIGVLGLGGHLPRRVRANSEVARAAGVSPEWISERTGVHARHVAAPGEAASDLAAAAVRSATRAAGIEPGDLSLLICATSTPDELGPATACRIQAALGAREAVALDVSAACSGWLFGTKVAHDWLAGSERPGYAAVVGVEAYSKFLDPTDRATSVLFADGAAATVLGPVPHPYGFTDFALGSDGTRADYVLIPAGGSRMPADPGTLRGGDHRIRMDGRAVSHFMDQIFPRIVADALDRNGLTLDDLACLASHQPNPAALRRLAARVGVPEDRLVIIGDRVGNIGAASAPYALATAAAQDRLRPGDRVLLTVFGAGMTWGTALLHWSGARSVGIDIARTPVDTDHERHVSS